MERTNTLNYRCGSNSDTLSCLRAADVNTLQTLNTNINLNGFYGTYTFVPVVDGTFIVERPTVTISKGRLNCDYLLAVTNANEGYIFVSQITKLDVADYVSELFPNFGPAQVAGAVMMYQDQGNNVNQANLVMGESIFICPTYHLLEGFGGQAWKGEFSVPPARHGYDMQYYFASDNSPFITAFSNSFMAVVMYNDPNYRYTSGDITPPWMSWLYRGTEMIFNQTSSGVPHIYTSKTDSALLERCAYWRNVSAYSAQ
ncbi:hypothetical protein K503DRAFT_800818 [Rhizopogon vinicolor AM-OR11-026]|uniref:Carboxylesterase type B domain-containing protein n=1 Tax=Rhizopogon vinicolor AM-OR11-026 TaxID=1314800 RepID=A0A1B7MZI8_9AGAM|nr:hypothetical protein K503DRAFT_800818 [Rhizopogon vinicolor AM-OR11-026]